LTTETEVHSAGAEIVFEQVSKSYGGDFSLADVSLRIERGEFITFLGPSGSGKTTTLNMIAGFLPETSGRITIDGALMSAVPPHKRDVGMVFQSYALFPHMTVAQNIDFPLRQRKIDKATRERLRTAALKTVRLEGFERRVPAELSGGQQQRVAFARAIVYSPSVLLMDEPLGALDKKLRDWLQLEIKRVHREVGSTFVYVTHDQEEALSLSDRIAVFNEGGIEQVGTPTDLYERPETMFVARFVGESCILRGAVDQSGSSLRLGETSVPLHGVVEAHTGEDAAVVVRPECVSLHGPDHVDAERAVVPARVIGSTYIGTRTRYQIEFWDGSLGVAHRGPREAVFPAGANVTVSWSPRDAVLVADDPRVDLTSI
jgi:putative spermidine/putrescine transport system ATP-binding protein